MASRMTVQTKGNKRAIEDHFDTAYELEAELVATGKDDLMALVHSIKPDDMDCVSTCRIPDDCIDLRRYPLLVARQAMR